MTATLPRPLPRLRRPAPPASPRPEPSPRPRLWRWAGFFILTGILIVCHGCHKDEDDEPGIIGPFYRSSEQERDSPAPPLPEPAP